MDIDAQANAGHQEPEQQLASEELDLGFRYKAILKLDYFVTAGFILLGRSLTYSIRFLQFLLICCYEGTRFTARIIAYPLHFVIGVLLLGFHYLNEFLKLVLSAITKLFEWLIVAVQTLSQWTWNVLEYPVTLAVQGINAFSGWVV
jgi:hypothetical protein